MDYFGRHASKKNLSNILVSLLKGSLENLLVCKSHCTCYGEDSSHNLKKIKHLANDECYNLVFAFLGGTFTKRLMSGCYILESNL